MCMSKRLQVILADQEYREVQRAAQARRMSLAEWVRQALELARRQQPQGGTAQKLEAINHAAQHEYPTGEVETMLSEIEAGYLGSPRA